MFKLVITPIYTFGSKQIPDVKVKTGKTKFPYSAIRFLSCFTPRQKPTFRKAIINDYKATYHSQVHGRSFLSKLCNGSQTTF